MSSKDGRTEKATPQRRKKARDEGQVPRSQEVAVAGTFLALVGVLAIAGAWMTDRAMASVREIYATAGAADALGASAPRSLTLFFVLTGPFLLAAAVAGTAAGVSQVGIKFNLKLVKPKLSNLSLKKGFEKFKPKNAAWELTRTVLKLSAVLAVVWPTISDWRDHIQNDRTLAGAMDRLSGAYGSIIVRAAILALIIAALDFTFQKQKIEKQMMMSRSDIKREFRDSEGDPYQKAARKARASDLTRNRMLRDVATADAVVANPTHLVVALRYDPGEGAPRVIAKGADHLATRIKDIARRHGVPVTTDVPLARALYKQCRVGSHVPVELYQAVAVVLAAAYRRTGRTPGSRRVPDHRRAVRIGGTA
ncbi:MAG: flagellar biosynthesis protein FlhB [Nitriliruptoraceae bacterium]